MTDPIHGAPGPGDRAPDFEAPVATVPAAVMAPAHTLGDDVGGGRELRPVKALASLYTTPSLGSYTATRRSARLTEDQ